MALKKKLEADRIQQLRKARDIGNKYSNSYSSRDARSQQRVSQQREARLKVVPDSPEKDISDIQISLNVSSIKKSKDDTLDSQTIHEIKEIRKSRQAKFTHSRKSSKSKNEKFEKYASCLDS